MPEKIIRDPVHDVIAFRLERPLDALLFKLLNAAEFQRLRRIHQLGMANLAYPGAEHTRYSHSLGVMETARRILDQLRRSFPIDPENETTCLVAALLHDLGHGPLSHVFERVSSIHHERLTQRIILDPDSDVHQILFQHDKLMPERVADFFKGEPMRNFFHDILSSQLDADRLDYLLRDNHMTGSRYGDYDLNWLLHAFTIDPATNRLAVTWKGISAVEAYLQSRHHMYRNVYFHKVVRSAEGMVKLALQRAKRLAVQGRVEWPARDTSVYKALTSQRFTIAEFRDLDDISVWHCLKLWAGADDAILAGLSRGLLTRSLFKTVDLTARMNSENARTAVNRAMKAIEEAGGEPHYDLFYDEPASTPYEMHDPKPAPQIMVIEADGTTKPFSEISPWMESLNRELMFRRIHVKPQWADLVRKVVL